MIVLIIIILAIILFLIWASASISSGVYLKAFCRGDKKRRVVYLTFDDGPVRDTTPVVLDVLARNNAKATFFLIGANVSGNEDIVHRIKSEGHEIGLHSFCHSEIFPLFSTKKMTDDVSACQSVVETAIGQEVSLFRPPFGVINPTVSKVVKSCGLRVVGWDVRSYDTMDYSTPKCRNKILHRVMRRVRPGSVILLHDRLLGEDVILQSLLEQLSEAGYSYDEPLPFINSLQKCSHAISSK